MKIREDNLNTIIEQLSDFDLTQTLECGQCFRFYKQDVNEYVVVASKRLLHIKQVENTLIFYNTPQNDVEDFWVHYFDLDRNYGEIKEYLLSKDQVLKNAIDEKWGVRLLNQEFTETLMSFIISQNKQIPHIKQIVKEISVRYGELLGEINGEKYYSFPDIDTLKKITIEEYRDMKTGFRAPYLYDAASKLADRTLNAEEIKKLSEEEAKTRLIEVKGVGEKVANCVLLFSLGFRNAFPVDVWIKRIMETLYFEGNDTKKEVIAEKAKELYGEYGGYAQQYLFSFGKDNKVGVKKEN